MSKSIKRNNKYFGEEYESMNDHYEEHRQHLREKRIRSALKSKNINALYHLDEDDY